MKSDEKNLVADALESIQCGMDDLSAQLAAQEALLHCLMKRLDKQGLIEILELVEDLSLVARVHEEHVQRDQLLALSERLRRIG